MGTFFMSTFSRCVEGAMCLGELCKYGFDLSGIGGRFCSTLHPWNKQRKQSPQSATIPRKLTLFLYLNDHFQSCFLYFLDDLPFGGRCSHSLISMRLTSNHDLRAFRQNLHFPRKEVTPHESHKLPTKYREILWGQQIKLNHALSISELFKKELILWEPKKLSSEVAPSVDGA